MAPQQGLAEWLAEDERRCVIMRRSTQVSEDGSTTVRDGHLRFDVYSHLPDGRRVAAGVSIPCEMIDGEPGVGNYVLMQAKLAAENLLQGESQ